MKKATGYYPGRFTNETRLKKQIIKRTMRILTTNWNDLQVLAENSKTSYRGVSKEDILIDAFEHVIRDTALKKASEKEIIETFKKEFKQLHFRAVKNCKAERRKYGLDL
jgi:uncharacterized protein YktA (UPF0223 family)